MILSTLTILNKTIQDKASSQANFLLKTTAFFIKKKIPVWFIKMISEKKERKLILLNKKSHVFVFHSSTYTVTNKIFQKEKRTTTNIGWDIYSRLFNWPLIQTTGVESLSAQINMMISSSFTPFFWNPTFFFFFFSLKSFWIIAKQSFSLQKCTLTRLFGFRRKPACLFTEYAGTMQNQVAARVL